MSDITDMYGGKKARKRVSPVKKEGMQVQKNGKNLKLKIDDKEIWVPSPDYVRSLEQTIHVLQDELRESNRRLRNLEHRLGSMINDIDTLRKRGGYSYE